METQRQPLLNRHLDALGQQWDEYKQSVRQVDMSHGKQGDSMPTRAAKIEALVRRLAELAPPRAQGVTIDPATASVDDLLGHIRQAREAVLPRRRPHEPKFKYAINSESRPHIAFLREFAGQWEGSDAPYAKQHFPHLYHAAQWSAQVVALYDMVDDLENRFNRATVSKPLTPEQRRELSTALDEASQKMLKIWPPILPPDQRAAAYLPEGEFKRYSEAVTHGVFYLNRLPSASHPDRADAVEDLQKSYNELRYEACAAAQRAFLQISRAYKADRKAMMGRAELQDARDPIRQELPMLDRVYHARWALLADAVFDTVRSNRKTLEKYSGLKPQTQAEQQMERREIYHEPVQGQLDLG